jgi:NAD(P)H-dependent FMN reductase
VLCLTGGRGTSSRTVGVTRWCAAALQAAGARATVLTGADLDLPFYEPGRHHGPIAARLLQEADAADAVLVVSAAYHGTVPGLLKNAFDHLNDLDDPMRPLLTGRTLGCVAVADGPQAAVSTVATLRTIGHALRAWPTPLGVAVHGGAELDAAGRPQDARIRGQLATMLGQLVDGPFAAGFAAPAIATGSTGSTGSTGLTQASRLQLQVDGLAAVLSR